MLRLLALTALVAAASAKAPPMPKSFDGRIVDGEDAAKGQFPFQVRIGFVDGIFIYVCGGSVLDETTVLSAAHCCDGDEYVADFGEWDTSVREGDEQYVYVSETRPHGDYNAFTFENDICILKLSQPVEYNDAVGPVTLPSEEDGAGEQDGEACVVSGWGTTSSGGQSAEILQFVEVHVVGDDECNSDYQSGGSATTESMICAADPGQDSCQGDSGGPLMCPDENGYQCGIVSWGYGCADPDFPGVYTQTSYFLDWISSNRN